MKLGDMTIPVTVKFISEKQSINARLALMKLAAKSDFCKSSQMVFDMYDNMAKRVFPAEKTT